MPTQLTPTARLGWAASDTACLIGRSVRHQLRSLDALIMSVLLPLALLLMFVYVFGGAISSGGRYIDYVVPGIVLLCAGFGSATAAVGVAEDMSTGVIDRFRSLPIVASAVLTGHVVATVVRNLLSTALVLGLALAIGYRPHAGVGAWVAVLGVLLVFMVAIAWLAAAFGLLARTPEGANAFSFIVMFLPYVSSAFVPTGTMPGVLGTVAQHQPVTPVVDTLRLLLTGGHPGGTAWTAIAWCAGLGLAGCGTASVLFRRRTAR
jgi:ABC-2 type transport system permease protein